MTNFGACNPWPVRWPCDVSCQSAAATGQAVQFATDIVWALSGRQFGTCEVTLRPCRDECYDTPWAGGVEPWPGTHGVGPALIAGLWYNIVCSVCTGTCSCTSVSEVTLPAPVLSIIEVRVDGTILPTGSYRLDDSRKLVRLDGDVWPRCNDLNLDHTQLDTWSVTAEYGQPVPEGGMWAVGEVACELLKAFTGEDCRLPRNITQLVRQGVTIQYPDMNQLFSRGLTGLYLADMWISSVNPNRLAARSRTYSVDRPPHRRVGT